MGKSKKTQDIVIKYCGGCNPEIDRPRMVKRLTKLLQSTGAEVRISLEHQDPGLLLLIQGCAHACLEHELGETEVPCLRVQGENIDNQPVKEEDLTQALKEKICRHIAG